MRDQSLVSVIIVNWNVGEMLVRCLRSLFDHNALLNLEVFVVDNHSNDGSPELVRREFPQVRLTENEENVGFARANNQSIRQANGKYILLLNPDTLWTDGSLGKMVDFMDSHKEVGITGPRLMNADRQSIQYWGGRRSPTVLDTFFEYTKLIRLFPNARLFGRYLMSDWDHTDSREVEAVSGACLLIRSETIKEVGLLDEGYALYQEDIDWCRRVGMKGWKIWYFAQAEVIHFGRQSTLQDPGQSTLKAVRGIYRYYHKFFGPNTAIGVWLLIMPASIVKLLAWTVVYMLGLGSREVALKRVKGYWEICRILPNGTSL